MDIPTKEQKMQRTIQRHLADETWETVASFQDLNVSDIFRLFEHDGTEIQMHKGGKSCPGRFRVQAAPFKHEDPKVERVKDRLAAAVWAVNAKPVWRFKTKTDIRKRAMKDGSVCGNDFSKRDTEVLRDSGWESISLMHVKEGDQIRYLEEGEYFEHTAASDAFYDDSLFPPCWAITVKDDETA